VTDDDGATDPASATLNVLNRPPVASITQSAAEVSQNEPISFDGLESYDPDGTIVSYVWDFGDGTTGTGVTASHEYVEDGNYQITLTVTDDDGESASAETTVTIETEAEPEPEEEPMQLAILSIVGLSVTALTATLLYGLFVRRRRRKKET